MEGAKYVHVNIEDPTDFVLCHFGPAIYNAHKEVFERGVGIPMIVEGYIRKYMTKIYVKRFTLIPDFLKRLFDGEPLTQFEEYLLGK